MYMLGFCKTGNNVSDAAIAKIDTMYRRVFYAKTRPVEGGKFQKRRRGGFLLHRSRSGK